VDLEKEEKTSFLAIKSKGRSKPMPSQRALSTTTTRAVKAAGDPEKRRKSVGEKPIHNRGKRREKHSYLRRIAPKRDEPTKFCQKG